MRYTAILLMLLFTAVAVDAEVGAVDRYVSQIEQSVVSFIYEETVGVVMIKTEDTAELVDELVAKAPTGLEVNVVVYKDTGNRKPGFKLEDPE